MEILPMGSVLETNLEGYLVNQSKIEKITSPWLKPISDIKTRYIKHFGDRIHSIYVRGSVSRGTALESVSDIDTVAVLVVPLTMSDETWAEETRNILENKYSFATEIAHDFISYEDVVGNLHNDGVSFNYAFTIKTLSVCIYGEDLSKTLPQFKPNRHTTLRLLSDLNALFDRAKLNMISQEPEIVQGWCRWVMKAIIRNAFLVVMEKEKVFTRDLFPCCSLFLKHYPLRETEIKQALDYAINPISDSKKVGILIDDFGSWLKHEIDKKFLSKNVL